MANKKIAILGTGGTIAGTAQSAADSVGYTAAQLGIAEVLASIPGLPSGSDLLVEQVAQIDSKDMSFAIWAVLAQRVSYFLQRDDVGAIVITHGTDTLEETAYFLYALFQPSKPVVLACAMRPATSVCPDGPQNLLDAVTVATFAGARSVLAVCAGTIHGALDVQKVHPYRLDAFSSGDSGAIGFVEDGNLRLARNWPPAQALRHVIAMEKIVNGPPQEFWPRVEIVMSHAGADGFLVDALVAAGVKGLVIACTGNGTLHHTLEAAVLRAQQAGVRVVRASRCWDGRMVAKSADLTSGENTGTGTESLSPVKARIALILELMTAS